ncbi:MAG: DUF3127 domain-containing protein [Chitinophagales bacterium]|nr:DUF3127 domain-containing protein [Chitinophagales bacterium]
MEVKGKLLQLLPLVTGEGKNGTWKKQEVIIETNAQYPKKICVSIWGDKINSSQLVIGNQLTLSIDLESREYNGRWYTEARAWKVDVDGQQPTPAREVAPFPTEEPPFEDDLPF